MYYFTVYSNQGIISLNPIRIIVSANNGVGFVIVFCFIANHLFGSSLYL